MSYPNDQDNPAGAIPVYFAQSPTSPSLYKNIATAATTLVKTGAGTLHILIVNTLIASATITIYDSLTGSGTKIATLTLPSTITGDAPFSLAYELPFATGLTIVTSGATDLTVSYE